MRGRSEDVTVVGFGLRGNGTDRGRLDQRRSAIGISAEDSVHCGAALTPPAAAAAAASATPAAAAAAAAAPAPAPAAQQQHSSSTAAAVVDPVKFAERSGAEFLIRALPAASIEGLDPRRFGPLQRGFPRCGD